MEFLASNRNKLRLETFRVCLLKLGTELNSVVYQFIIVYHRVFNWTFWAGRIFRHLVYRLGSFMCCSAMGSFFTRSDGNDLRQLDGGIPGKPDDRSCSIQSFPDACMSCELPGASRRTIKEIFSLTGSPPSEMINGRGHNTQMKWTIQFPKKHMMFNLMTFHGNLREIYIIYITY